YIEVVSESHVLEHLQEVESPSTVNEEYMHETIVREHSHVINIALVGNPNSGKTSLFNALSGGSEHVGNYSGVTVDSKLGHFNYKNYRINITDLPGTYALSGYSPEELYVRDHITEKAPDIVLNVVAASNLERNLYLTTELIDANVRMVVALNMYDELENEGSKLNHDLLGKMLGTVMVPVVARKSVGIENMLDNIISVFENNNKDLRHIHINHTPVIEKAILRLTSSMKENIAELPPCFPPRYWALKMLEEDKHVEKTLSGAEHYSEWVALRDKGIRHINRDLSEDVETALTREKYGFIEGALLETFVQGNKGDSHRNLRIDRLVTSRYFGFPIFIGLMVLTFWATFTLGAYPMEWIEMLVELLANFMDSIMNDGPLKSLVVDGIIGGVGSVIVFLPNIMILYLFISLMEDSGYMARAAFIMDRIMHRIGLHGKSFIPLIMGFGCNVPSIMATRTIESHSSRIITILINPFISCSARLPVFILLAGVFFPNYPGLMVAAMYFLGIAVAVISARIMRQFIFKKDETPFVMEMPPYRVPTTRSALKHMWDKGAQYLRKMGSFILLASIIIWFLSYYPRVEQPAVSSDAAIEFADLTPEMEDSYLGRLGHFCEPVMRPLGLNWKASVALLSGVAAKEVVVSTLGVLYDDDDNAPLTTKLIESNDYTTGSALAFMIFILLYIPCTATVVAVYKETGWWGWAVVSVVYTTAVAWLLGCLAYNLMNIL
ncbi:MAG: ferrous iron transport protein B, partial [Rikenellaceae bacterium]